MISLNELGRELGLTVHGNPDHVVSHLAPIESAGASDLAFVVGRKYLSALKNSKAGAVIVPEDMLDEASGNLLVSANPYASYAEASWLLQLPRVAPAGIHSTALVHPEAQVAETASVGPFCVIGPGVILEDSVVVGSHCTVGAFSSIGEGSQLFPGVRVYHNVKMGKQCRVQSGAVLGSEGFGYAWADDSWNQIQQTGGVLIGDAVHVGANTTIDCGAIEPTVIEEGVILDNQIQIAHNVHIGRNTAIAGCVGIAGSTRIGSHCQIGGACNIVGHLVICDQVIINAASLVTRSINESGRYGSGMPLQKEKSWRRSYVNLGKLDKLFKRVRQLERQDSTDDRNTDQSTNKTSAS